jgi:hypothetical protein
MCTRFSRACGATTIGGDYSTQMDTPFCVIHAVDAYQFRQPLITESWSFGGSRPRTDGQPNRFAVRFALDC